MRPQLQKRQELIKGRREKRKLARQARHRRQFLRYTLLTLLLCVGVAGFVYMPWTFKSADTDIVIHGNQVATDDQIRECLRKFAGQPLYKLNPKSMEASVNSLPIIRHSFVRRGMVPRPHLVVEVMEEFPWATCVTQPDGPPEAVIAESGRSIPVAQFPRVVQPALRICGPSGIRLNESQIAQWDSWVKFVAAQSGQPVTLIDMRQPTSVALYTGDLCLHIGVADSTLSRRLGRLSSVLPVVSSLKERVQYIDLSLDSNVPLKIDKNHPKNAAKPAAAQAENAPVVLNTVPVAAM